MVQNVWKDGVKTVIVPSVVHLAALGNPVVMKVDVEQHIGGKMLFTTLPPIDGASVPVPAPALALSSTGTAHHFGPE